MRMPATAPVAAMRVVVLSGFTPAVKKSSGRARKLVAVRRALGVMLPLVSFAVAGFSIAAAAQVKKIAVLVPEQATDYGWNQQGVDAARAVAEKFGLEFLPVESLDKSDIRPTLRELAGEGASLIIAHAAAYNTAAPEIAHETGVPVAIVDNPEAMKEGLITNYVPSGHEGAYLAGRLAAKTTRSGKVGIVVSAESPSWNSQSAGFAMGAKSENPDISIIYAVIGPMAYADAPGGRRVTESVISAGADVVFGQGNGSSFGMIQAVETTEATDGGKVWFIDVIGDKTKLDKGHLLSSVLWNMEPVYTAMVEDLNSGTFGTKDYQISLADDSVGLLKTEHIADEVWQELMAIRDQIIAGEVGVDLVFDAQEVRALMSSIEAAE